MVHDDIPVWTQMQCRSRNCQFRGACQHAGRVTGGWGISWGSAAAFVRSSLLDMLDVVTTTTTLLDICWLAVWVLVLVRVLYDRESAADGANAAGPTHGRPERGRPLE